MRDGTPDRTPTLVVKGQGVASAEPDQTILTFTVLGREPSYSTAVEELNDRVETLREDITKEGVGRHRLKTAYGRDTCNRAPLLCSFCVF